MYKNLYNKSVILLKEKHRNNPTPSTIQAHTNPHHNNNNKTTTPSTIYTYVIHITKKTKMCCKNVNIIVIICHNLYTYILKHILIALLLCFGEYVNKFIDG